MILSIQELNHYQWIHGIFTLIFVIISILIGLQILSKYFKAEGEKFSEFILVGLTYIFLSSAWWGPAFNFLVFVTTGIPLPPLLFVILNNAFVPVAIVCWIYAYSGLQMISIKKELRLSYLIISVIWEIVFLILIILSLETFYTFEYTAAGIYYTKRAWIMLIYPIFALVSGLITGVLFGKQGLSSQDKVIRWKGIFLMLAFSLFVGISFLDAFLPIEIGISVIIIRSLLIFSGFCYYLGFFMPKSIKTILIK